MADDGQTGGAPQPTAAGDIITQLSEFLPYGDEPPRLCVGLNDLTDARDGAQFAKQKKRKPKAGPKAPPEFGAEMNVPVRDALEVAGSSGTQKMPLGDGIRDLVNRVEGRLLTGISFAWFGQIGQVLQWAPAYGPEEQWAELLTEQFLGITYLGPGPAYNFDAAQMVTLPKQPGEKEKLANTNPKTGGTQVVRGNGSQVPWESFAYSRIERTRTVYADDKYDIASWEDPTSPKTASSSENADPVIPICNACQHMTTYGLLTRGIPLAAFGDSFFLGAGLSASDGCWGQAAFNQAKAFTHKSGFSYQGPHGFRILPHDKSLREIKVAKEKGLAPGSIVVYDPDRGAKNKPLYFNDYELKKYGWKPDTDPVTVYGKYYATRTSVADSDVTFGGWDDPSRPGTLEADIAKAQNDVTALENAKFPNQKKIDAAKARVTDLENQRGKDTVPRPHKFEYPGLRQYDGAHIFFILRVHPTKPYMQTFDVNQRSNMSDLGDDNNSLIFAQTGAGVIDGASKKEWIYDDNNGFAGIGVPPKVDVTAEQIAFLKKARPAGLARLVVTARLPEEGQKTRLMTPADVHFVSAMFRMYDDDPSQNHYISHLLWAIRNSTGFTVLQPWWCVFYPKGLFAKCLWAHGARTMKIGDFVAKHRSAAPHSGKLRADDVGFALVLTNEAKAPRAGHSILYSRCKSKPNGSQTEVYWEPNKPPPPILHHVDPAMVSVPDASKRSLAWNETYVSPNITLDLNQLPARFRTGG